MIEPTVKSHQGDLSLLLESMKGELTIGQEFPELHEACDRALIFCGIPTKTWFMQRLFMEALTQEKELPIYVCMDADYAELDFERMSRLFQKNLTPILTDGDVKTLFESAPVPKKKFWVEMNEQHARRSRRHRSKYKKQ